MADNFEVELPEELIQRIQSFLDTKEVARTSILSKLWYSAWSTRPILCLDYNFPITGIRFTEFENFSRGSINRYKKLNLKLNTFKLSMSMRDDDDYHNEFSDYESCIRLVNDLILSALTLGVNDLDLCFCEFISKYTLPDKVFSSIYLKKLFIDGVKINLPQSKVVCSRLVSLELSWVCMSDDMMKDILLGCPLMEDLRVSYCIGLKKINLGVIRLNLKTLHVQGWNTLVVEWDENSNAPGLQNQFQKLISLKLSWVEVDDLFCKSFSHRFPCLEKLQLKYSLGPVMINIDITSNSLRYLTLKSINGLRFIKVQAPNIHNFRLVNSKDEGIPSLSFLRIPGEWKSDLSFYQPVESDDSWLLKIKDILTELSQSRISLSIGMSRYYHLGTTGISKGIKQSKRIVENLEIETRGWVIELDWLLLCQPKYITWIDCYDKKVSYELLELAYNELKKNGNKNVSYSWPCIHDLEEVDMEHYDETLREWRLVGQEAKKAAHEGGKFRLRLTWYYPS